MRRVVSVWLPHWSTDRLRRRASSLPEGQDQPPLVTVITDHGRRVIAGVDARARAAGATAGMTLTKARMLAGSLEAIDADPQADLDGLRSLALWAGKRYSPHVAPCPPDGLWLDIGGCAPLFDGETPLLKDLHRRLRNFGLTVQIAAADTAGCAHAVARHVPAGRPVTIDPGKHRAAIALLPMSALRLETNTIDALAKLGFERIEQLMGPTASIVRPLRPASCLSARSVIPVRLLRRRGAAGTPTPQGLRVCSTRPSQSR